MKWQIWNPLKVFSNQILFSWKFIISIFLASNSVPVWAAQVYEFRKPVFERPDDIYQSTRISIVPEGAKVIYLKSLGEAFAKAGISAYHQSGGTCVGHAIGQIIDFQIVRNGNTLPSRVADAQLFLQILTNEYVRLYENPRKPMADTKDRYRFVSGGELYDNNIEDTVPVKFLAGSTFKDFTQLLRKYPNVCRMAVNDRNVWADFNRILADFVDYKEKKIPVEKAVSDISFGISKPKPSEKKILDLLNSTDNPFLFVNRLIYPSCQQIEAMVAIDSVLRTLKIVERGQGMLESNFSLETALIEHFKNRNDPPPIAFAYAPYFNDTHFLSGNDYGFEENSRILSFDFDKLDAFPWSFFSDPIWLTLPSDMNEHWNLDKHASVLKGMREVQLSDGTVRTDFLIEDSGVTSASNLPFWENGPDYHYWVDAKTLVANILELAFFEE